VEICTLLEFRPIRISNPCRRMTLRKPVQLPVHVKFTPGVAAVEFKVNEVPDVWDTVRVATAVVGLLQRDQYFDHSFARR